MPKYWMISGRNLVSGPSGPVGFGSDVAAALTYWFSDGTALDVITQWQQVDHDTFKAALLAAADLFPPLPHAQNEDQKHVTFLVHGFNVGWEGAARMYQSFSDRLYNAAPGPQLGLCVSYDWPSLGSLIGYLPDRTHAVICATQFAAVLAELYDWLLVKQKAAQFDPSNACKAKLSIVAHSMGNFLSQKALAGAWTRSNQPLLASLISQFIMVAADVDNDLFEPDAPDGTDGNAIANLCYRTTALYSGRDAVLGISAGLKHFGTRRLGRTGLAVRPPTGKDNVWDIDCSGFFPGSVTGMDAHSAYFAQPPVLDLMAKLLIGIDRSVLQATGATVGKVWP